MTLDLFNKNHSCSTFTDLESTLMEVLGSGTGAVSSASIRYFSSFFSMFCSLTTSLASESDKGNRADVTKRLGPISRPNHCRLPHIKARPMMNDVPASVQALLTNGWLSALSPKSTRIWQSYGPASFGSSMVPYCQTPVEWANAGLTLLAICL